jgi:hypothetical protein
MTYAISCSPKAIIHLIPSNSKEQRVLRVSTNRLFFPKRIKRPGMFFAIMIYLVGSMVSSSVSGGKSASVYSDTKVKTNSCNSFALS